VVINEGRTGGPVARAAQIEAGTRRDLDLLGQHLHQRYREAIERHGMQGRAQVFDHCFTWRTEFDLSWSEAWTQKSAGASAGAQHRGRHFPARVEARR